MGKREQFIRVLLGAAETLGWLQRWTDTDLEEAIEEARNDIAGVPRASNDRSDWEAWLCLYDTMQMMAPRGGVSDEPRAKLRKRSGA